jgi:hypothetical protein
MKNGIFRWTLQSVAMFGLYVGTAWSGFVFNVPTPLHPNISSALRFCQQGDVINLTAPITEYATISLAKNHIHIQGNILTLGGNPGIDISGNENEFLNITIRANNGGWPAIRIEPNATGSYFYYCTFTSTTTSACFSVDDYGGGAGLKNCIFNDMGVGIDVMDCHYNINDCRFNNSLRGINYWVFKGTNALSVNNSRFNTGSSNDNTAGIWMQGYAGWQTVNNFFVNDTFYLTGNASSYPVKLNGYCNVNLIYAKFFKCASLSGNKAWNKTANDIITVPNPTWYDGGCAAGN